MFSTNPHIKAVIFDADGTLFSVNGSFGSRYCGILSRYGASCTVKELDEIIIKNWIRHLPEYLCVENGYQTDLEKERENWRTFVRRIYEELKIESDFETFFKELYDDFATGASRTLEDGIVDFLEELFKTELVLAVFTNNDGRIRSVLKDVKLDGYFNFVFTAGELGFKKPSKKAFERLAEKLGFEAKEILHIGDEPKYDYYPVLEAGMKALAYAPDIKGASEIDSFFSFRELIGGLVF